MKTAVIYTCHLEGRKCEPDNKMQIALCKEYVQKNGIEIVGSYTDGVATKSELLYMKQALITDCQQKRWDMILFSSVTILGRKLKAIKKFLSELSKYVDYKFVDQESDAVIKSILYLTIDDGKYIIFCINRR